MAREMGETSVMLLVHPTLTEQHIHQACDVVRDVMLRATESKVFAAAAKATTA